MPALKEAPLMPASDAQRLKTADRRARNLEMRLAGARWDRIAEVLGYSNKAAACKDFGRALAATRADMKQSAAELREVQALRLERLNAAFWPKSMKGDHQAGKVCLDIHRELVKLFDLTGAQKTMDNAVDAWIEHLAGGGLDEQDAAALAAVA